MRGRKYPTKEKTTTLDGYREYKKFQMRDYRAKKSVREARKNILLAIRKSSEYKSLSTEEQSKVNITILDILDETEKRLMEKVDALIKEAKFRLDMHYDKMIRDITLRHKLLQILEVPVKASPHRGRGVGVK